MRSVINRVQRDICVRIEVLLNMFECMHLCTHSQVGCLSLSAVFPTEYTGHLYCNLVASSCHTHLASWSASTLLLRYSVGHARDDHPPDKSACISQAGGCSDLGRWHCSLLCLRLSHALVLPMSCACVNASSAPMHLPFPWFSCTCFAVHNGKHASGE